MVMFVEDDGVAEGDLFECVRDGVSSARYRIVHAPIVLSDPGQGWSSNSRMRGIAVRGCVGRAGGCGGQVGLAPELTQAAYRVGDSTTNRFGRRLQLHTARTRAATILRASGASSAHLKGPYVELL